MMSNKLYQLHEDVIADFQNKGNVNQFAWSLPFECLASELEDLRMPDAARDASLWRRNPCPDELYFSHGEYIGNGLNFLIEELKTKPSSNRALYSLISEGHIKGSGDTPIPSFMVFQCAVVDDVLKCAAYFRALEVSKFLRVNLEEIRQNLVDIVRELPHLKKVSVTIFAFRAYVDKNASMLKKPEIELLKDDQLQKLLLVGAATPQSDLERLLLQLHDSVTVVSSVKLESLRRIISDDGPTAHLHPEIARRRPLLLSRLADAIQRADSLEEARKRSSHGENIEKSIDSYRGAILALRNALR